MAQQRYIYFKIMFLNITSLCQPFDIQNIQHYQNKLKCTRYVQIMIENPYNCKIKNEYGNEFIDISHV